jgi:translation initiation factor 2 beta subunit (eIF-2beta)/eIF-5
MRHKLTTFIVKNPPKKAKKAKKDKDATGGKEKGSEGSADDAGSDDDFTKKLKADAADLPTAEQVEALGNRVEEWSLDTSPEAVRARAKQALEDAGDDSEGEGADSPYGQLKIWAEANRDTATPVEVFKKVQELGLEKKHKSLQVLAQNLFTEDIVEQIPKFGPVFKKVCVVHDIMYFQSLTMPLYSLLPLRSIKRLSLVVSNVLSATITPMPSPKFPRFSWHYTSPMCSRKKSLSSGGRTSARSTLTEIRARRLGRLVSRS